MKSNTKKSFVMLGLGLCFGSPHNVNASENIKEEASIAIEELIADGEIRQNNAGKLLVSPYALQILSETNLISDEEIIDRLEEKLQIEPQLLKAAHAGAVL